MQEIELKFQVTSEARERVRRAVATGTARTTRMQAMYFDTPDRRLATAGIALRLRKEGRHWVQTLKGRGDGLMQRVEHEVPLAPARGAPVLDLARHDATPAAALLEAALGDAAGTLQVLFATDIKRTHRMLRVPGGAIEIAFDEGLIRAGEARASVCEIEFELLRGPPQALIALAARWVARHGLWLDPRSKAERGDRLARGEARGPVVHAQAVELRALDRPADALGTMLKSTLSHVLPNAAEVAGGEFTPAHVHQLRVGLRRLRTALRLFGGWQGGPEAGAGGTEAALEAGLRDIFARLGAARDRDAISASLLPGLAAAGAPPLVLPAVRGAEAPPDVLRDRRFSLLMLEVMALAQPAPHAPPRAPWSHDFMRAAPSLNDEARRVIRRAYRGALADAAAFATLDEAAQHRVRKRLKRLRYAVEFSASLFPDKAVKRFLAALRPAQEALGDYNDALVAEGLFRTALTHDPRAWFALGWLAAQRLRLLRRCARRLEKLAAAPLFWKGR